MAPSDATMSQMFQRIVHVKVGKEEEIFSIHADLMVQHMFYFARVLETGPAITSWSLPTVTPRSFHLLLDYVYGGPLKLSWANVKDRPDLVDAWVLGDMVGATRFSNMIIETIATNATRPGPRCKLLPDNVCINHAYTPNVTEKNAPMRTLFVDLHVHFGTPDTLNELLAGPHNLRDFWFDYCSRSRKRDEHDTAARKRGTALRMFSPGSYSNTHPHYATPEPIPVTRPGTKAYLCHYDGVNTIVVEDGGQPLFVHRELSELRQDILLKCPPRDIVFPAGWRPAAVIFLKWLYFGRVTQETHHLRDFIRAYTLGLTLHNPQFRDDILTAIISYCTRNQLLPSATELALAYTASTPLEPHHSPLRHLLVCWTLTHRHHLDAAALAMPLNPASLPMDPALREALARDLGAEREARTTSMIADMAAMRKAAAGGRGEQKEQHPRPYADERFAGDVALGGVVRGAAPYYGDDVCRFHAAHPYFGYRAPLANGDGEVNGGVGMGMAAAESSSALGAAGGGRGLAAAAAKGGVEHGRVAALLGFSTKVSKAEDQGRSKQQPAMKMSKSSAATGWKNPANDMQSEEAVENNPCHALLRKRNCYGAVVVGYRPKPIWPETTNGIRDSVTSSTESQDKGGKIQAAAEPFIAKRDEDYAKDPEILAMLAEVEDRLNSVSLTTTTTNLRPPSPPPPPPSPQHHQPRPPPALNTGPMMQHQARAAGQTSSTTPYTSPTAPHFTAGFPQPQYDVGYNNLSGSSDGYEDNDQNFIAAFNALRLPPGWQQRRCVDGRAYWVRLVPGSRRTEATWVDPREGVVWRRSDEVSFVPGMGWGFEEGTETEVDDDESRDDGSQGTDEDMPDQQGEENMDGDGGGSDIRDFAPAVEKMVEAE